MSKERTRYKYGDYIIRQIKGRYYVYKIENVDGEAKERYVGSLADVVETYLKLKANSSEGLGVSPKPTWARWDLNPGPLPCKGSVLTRLDDGPSFPIFH